MILKAQRDHRMRWWREAGQCITVQLPSQAVDPIAISGSAGNEIRKSFSTYLHMCAEDAIVLPQII